MGPDWFTLPKGTTSRQVQALLKIAHAIKSILSELPAIDGLEGKIEFPAIDGLEGKTILKCLQTLAAEPPGRKPSPKFDRALELKRAGKTIHQICHELTPAYAQKMTADDRRRERNKMQSGVKRLEQNKMKNSEGPRNTPR
jgi:hypothetical protein